MLSLNLGRLVESVDEREEALGLEMCLFMLRYDKSILLCDLLTNDQIIARDRITK